jgi:hypothetical protein
MARKADPKLEERARAAKKDRKAVHSRLRQACGDKTRPPRNPHSCIPIEDYKPPKQKRRKTVHGQTTLEGTL